MRGYFNKMKTFLLTIILMLAPIVFLSSMKNSVDAIEENEKKFIVIDPGHGGIDGGGMSVSGVYEKEINLSISYYLKTYLENCGYNVVLTRSGDYDLASKGSNNRKKEDISKRVDIINNENTILFISIHCNIYSDESIRGAQTFYNSTYEENKILSNKIQNRLCNILKNTNRKEKSITDKYLIDKSIKTGCLIEVGFLSNKEEFNLLVNPAYQDKIAYSIYIGIMEFLGINNNF